MNNKLKLHIEMISLKNKRKNKINTTNQKCSSSK